MNKTSSEQNRGQLEGGQKLKQSEIRHSVSNNHVKAENKTNPTNKPSGQLQISCNGIS